MRIRSFSYPLIAAALGLAIVCNSASAFDLNDDSEKSRSPFELFKFGFSAYKSGHKVEACSHVCRWRRRCRERL